MLTSISASVTKGPAKIVMAVLMLLLILSFALWGIEDVFRGQVSTDVATVGKTRISALTFQDAYRERTNAIVQASKQHVSPEIARALGIDKQILETLISAAALDEQTGHYQLAMNSQQVFQAVANDPAFQMSQLPGQPPVFDAGTLRNLLRQSGMSEAGFFAAQRQIYLRAQLEKAFVQGGPVSSIQQQAMLRFAQEKRNVSYFIVPQSAAGEISQPDARALNTFFEENRGSFRAPEFRSASYIKIGPQELEAQIQVDEADIQKMYDERKNSYSTPEKRTIEQLNFPNIDEAKAASKRISSGQITFDELVKERKLKPEDIALGSLTRPQLADSKIAEAAFSLKEGGASEAIEGKLTNAIVRVLKIEPAYTPPLDQLRDDIRKALVAQRSSAILKKTREKIDDLRIGGSSLSDIAKDLSLKLVTIPSVNRMGNDQTGKPVDMPLKTEFVSAVFKTSPGSDPDALDGREEGLLWYSVDNITPERERAFTEVEADVAKAWTENESARLLKAKTDDLVRQLESGAQMADVAKPLNLQVLPAWGLTRLDTNQPLPPAVVSLIFATPLKGYGSSLAPSGTDRIIFHVEDSIIPAFDAKTAEAVTITLRLSEETGRDLMKQYVTKIEKSLGVNINQANVDRIVGGGPF